MKINKTENVMGIYMNNMVNKMRDKKASVGKKDGFDFSEKAKDFQFALEKLKNLPDVRADKVESLKKQVQAGTYNVEGRKIAEKMLDSIGFDKRI